MKLLHVRINDKGCVDKTTTQNSPLTGYDQQMTKGLGGWVIFPSTCCGNEGKQRNEMEKTPEISGWINLTTLCDSDR